MSGETCPVCGDPMPEHCSGPSGRHQPIPVTSPARGGPDTAGQGEMAVVLASHRLTTPRQCFCGEREFFEDALHRPEWHVAHVLSALLPVVQRLAAEKAAEELRAAAESPYPYDRGRKGLRDRADALAAAAQPGDGRTGE